MTDTQAASLPEAFQLDSGLREDMVLTVYTAYFAPHAEYQEGKQLMLWLIGTDENQEAVEIRMSIGADWTTDDGTVITHPTKRKQHINKNSIYGFWLQWAFQIPELTRILIERSQALGEMGPRDARIWVNLVLQLNAKELSWGRGIDPQERLMPTALLGLADQTVQAPPAATTVPPTPPFQPPPIPPAQGIPPVPAAAQQASPAPVPAADPMAAVNAARAAAAEAAAVSNGSPLFARAIQLAKDAPDFATFLSQAFSVPEILADDELAQQCADEKVIYAAAKSSA